MIDTHAHYHDKRYDQDRDALLRAMHEEGVEMIIDMAAEPSSIGEVLSLCDRYDFVYGALGLHPDEIAGLPGVVDEIRAHLSDEKIVAVGEIGLDYHWMENPKDVQEEAFRTQCALAVEAGLPVIIHSRDAAEDTMRILREETPAIQQAVANKRGVPNAAPGVMHCYSYALPDALSYIEMGYYLGIGGVVTFSNAKKLKEVVAHVPIEHIILETDAPYLAPDGHRGERNESRYIRIVIAEIARLKGISEEEVENITTMNAKALFAL